RSVHPSSCAVCYRKQVEQNAADHVSCHPGVPEAGRGDPFGGTTVGKAMEGAAGYFAGSPKDYDRAYALDVPQLFAFLRATQPEAFKKLAIPDTGDPKDINRL